MAATGRRLTKEQKKEKKRARNKAYDEANPEKKRARNKAWREANPGYSKAYDEANPEKKRARDKAYYEANSEKKRTKARLYKYGLDSEGFSRLLTFQNNCCWICKAPFPTTPCVDHDHDTGVVRGLLCMKCNRDEEVFTNRGHLIDRHLEFRRNPPARQLGIHTVGSLFKKTLSEASP